MRPGDSAPVFTLPPSTPACVRPARGARREHCGQLGTDQPLCPQHKRPSSFRGNGQNGFCPTTTGCLWLGWQQQQQQTKCLFCVLSEALPQSELASRRLTSPHLYKPEFNFSRQVLQLCHKAAQVALESFSPSVRGSKLLFCCWSVERCSGAQQSHCWLFLSLAA